MSLGTGFNNLEMIRLARDYAEQKGIGFHLVIKAIEDALTTAESKRYHYDKLLVKIDENTGKISMFKQLKVVEDEEFTRAGTLFADGYQCIRLSDAKKIDDTARGDSIVTDVMSNMELDRSSIAVVRNVMNGILTGAIKEKQYNEFRSRVGEVLSGIVKRVDNNSLTIEVNGTEVVMPARNLIKGELYRRGDRIKVYLADVNNHAVGDSNQLVLSRIHPEFVSQLIKQEVPEIYDGIVQIKSVARSPGSRSKVAVVSGESGIDAVGACVGMRGSRIRMVTEELKGEKIDVVEYSEDPVAFAINALSPANISKVIVDDKHRRIEVVLPESQLSIAIGSRGQNVGLASVLIGWRIDVLSEDQEAKCRSDEFAAATAIFMENMDVDEIIAQLLVTEGYDSIKSVAEASIESLTAIEGFDEAVAEEIRNRASAYLDTCDDTSVNDVVVNNNAKNSALTVINDITPELLLRLNEAGVNIVSDLADLSVMEVRDVIGDIDITDENIGDLIMQARDLSGDFN